MHIYECCTTDLERIHLIGLLIRAKLKYTRDGLTAPILRGSVVNKHSSGLLNEKSKLKSPVLEYNGARV